MAGKIFKTKMDIQSIPKGAATSVDFVMDSYEPTVWAMTVDRKVWNKLGKPTSLWVTLQVLDTHEAGQEK